VWIKKLDFFYKKSNNRSMKKALLLLTILSFASLANFAIAEDLATSCSAISDAGCSSTLSSADCKTLLQKCADYYDQQSAQISED